MQGSKRKVFKSQLVYSRANPNHLDLRFKRNRQWIEQRQKKLQLALPF